MARVLTRPLFRKGGLSQTPRPTYRGGGLTTIRPRYRNGGMNGIMSGIVPRRGYQNQGLVAPLYNPTPFKNISMSTPTTTSNLDDTRRNNLLLEGGDIIGGGNLEYYDVLPYLFSGRRKIEEQEKMAELPSQLTTDTGAKAFKKPVVKNGKTLGDDTGLDTGTGAESDLETMKSYMKMFEGALGADADETRRQKYLELAKFGANLVAQPGGDLMGAIGKAAAPSIEGVSKIIGGERDVKRQARIAGLQAALKGIDPTSLEKTVRYLKKQGYSEAQAINMALSGTATKGKTKESRIKSIADDILQSGGAKDQATAKKISQKIEASSLHFYEYSPLPENPIEGQYYYDKEGKVGQYQIKDGKSGLYEQD